MKNKKIVIRLAIVVLIVLGVGIYNYVEKHGPFRLSGTIVVNEIHLGSKISGRIAEVLVKEFTKVKKGDVIVRFEPYDLPAQRAQAEAVMMQAKANLDKMVHGYRKEEVLQTKAEAGAMKAQLDLLRHGSRIEDIEYARAQLKLAEAQYQNAQSKFERMKSLYKQELVSFNDYDAAKTAFDVALQSRDAAQQKLDLVVRGARVEDIETAQRHYDEAKSKLDMYYKGNRAEDIEIAKADYQKAAAALQIIDTQIAELEIKAPTDAVVEVISVRPGDMITPASPIATLLESDQIYLKIFVPETKIGQIKLGMPVNIGVDSFPEMTFKGVIERIASQAEFTPRNVQTLEDREFLYFAVRIKILEGLDRIRSGMAASVTFEREKYKPVAGTSRTK